MGRDRSRLGHQEGPLVTLLATPEGRLQGRVLAWSPLSFLVLINSMSGKATPWVCPRPRGTVPDAPVFTDDNSTFHREDAEAEARVPQIPLPGKGGPGRSRCLHLTEKGSTRSMVGLELTFSIFK